MAVRQQGGPVDGGHHSKQGCPEGRLGLLGGFGGRDAAAGRGGPVACERGELVVQTLEVELLDAAQAREWAARQAQQVGASLRSSCRAASLSLPTPRPGAGVLLLTAPATRAAGCVAAAGRCGVGGGTGAGGAQRGRGARRRLCQRAVRAGGAGGVSGCRGTGHVAVRRQGGLDRHGRLRVVNN